MTRRSKQTPSSSNDEMIRIDCNFVHQTQDAYLLEVLKPGSKKETREWFPKSRCSYHHKGLDEWIMVPEWLALEKGLI